jgi:hypothetical protein
MQIWLGSENQIVFVHCTSSICFPQNNVLKMIRIFWTENIKYSRPYQALLNQRRLDAHLWNCILVQRNESMLTGKVGRRGDEDRLLIKFINMRRIVSSV